MRSTIHKKVKLTCPKCNSDNFQEILYGYVNPDTTNDSDILGGCVIDEDSPRWHCESCQHGWGKLELN